MVVVNEWYVMARTSSRSSCGITQVGAGLCTAVLAAACSAAVEARVQRSRDAVLLSLGTTTGTLWRARLLATTTPLAVGAVVASLVGGLLGYLYLSYVDYPELRGGLHGFPVGTYLLFTLIETALILVISLAFQRLIVGRASHLNATVVRALNE